LDERIRIALIATITKHLSHAQHIGDRFLVGYPWKGRWHAPAARIVSLYVDQHPEGDQSAGRAREFGFEVYPTIAEALRCGGPELAVDGVLIIGEHGDYPRNELGQILYPRYEFFKACVKVFEEDGRSVPVFNDKHLSYDFARAKEMVEDARRLGFPLLAGSSLPVTWRLPDVELPLGCELEEALVIGVGESDAMDYHALEAMQCMVERRGRGETGVRRVQLLDGEAVCRNCWSPPSPGATRCAASPSRTAGRRTSSAAASCAASWSALPPTASSTGTASAAPCSCSTGP
jgi:hypothetical protein